VASAVAKAAMASGVAKNPITDWEAYELHLSTRLGKDNTLSKVIETKAKQDIKRIVFADAENISVLKAAHEVLEEKIALPILLGNVQTIKSILEDNQIKLPGVRIIDPGKPADKSEKETLKKYEAVFYEKRKRKGVNLSEATSQMRARAYYGAMMVEMGDADAMIGGLSKKYPDTLKPALKLSGHVRV
jgi:malate dehydrogenase (oxaloacetate-decarboxylating)(NADP+)